MIVPQDIETGRKLASILASLITLSPFISVELEVQNHEKINFENGERSAFGL